MMTGKMTNTNGVGTAGVTVARTGNSQPIVTVTTVADGSYSFPNSIDDTYVITPTLAGATFLPLTQSLTVCGQNATGGSLIEYPGNVLAGQVTSSLGAKLAGSP